MTQDLLHTAFTCKSIRDMVSTRMVVKSALLHGGHAKKTMEELHALMSNHSMHVPSPLRLLRMANGKVCEFCQLDRVNHVRPGIGVFACWDCVTNGMGVLTLPDLTRQPPLTRTWKTSWVRYTNNRERYNAIFGHRRVASSLYGSKYFLWSEHRTDGTGERVGPIVAWDDVDRLCNHFHSANEVVDDARIDEYLVRNLNAPPIESYCEYNDAFADAQRRAEAAAQERYESARAKKAKTKDGKRAKAEKMLVDLSALIDEPFREIAMKRKPNPSFSLSGVQISKTPCIVLETTFIDDLLRPYIITPSKMNKRTLSELAVTINGKLRLITDTNFLNMDYLSESNQFEAALKNYLREMLPDVNELFRVVRHRINNRLFKFLQAGEWMEAAGYLMNDNLSHMLLTIEPTAEIARSTTAYDNSVLKKIADTVWYECLKNEESVSIFKERYSRAFDASQEMFGDTIAALDEFYEWLVEQHPDRTRMWATNRRDRAADRLYLDDVLKRNYAGLLDLQMALGH